MKTSLNSLEDCDILIKMAQGKAFIEHIEKHLIEEEHKNALPKGKVICKICGKTVEQIFEESKDE